VDDGAGRRGYGGTDLFRSGNGSGNGTGNSSGAAGK